MKPVSDHIKEALRVIEYGKEKGIPIRVLGATAIRIHCPKYAELHKSLGRELTDIDFAAYIKHSKEIVNLFEELGYTQKRYLSVMMGDALKFRRFFFDEGNNRLVDVFLDKLSMCHEINFKERLEVDYPTLPLAELFLTKMQIVKLTIKDVKDLIVLLMEHEIGDNDNDTININHIAKLLSKDWGFYYTVTLNIDKIKKYMDESTFNVMSASYKDHVKQKLDKMLKVIEEYPKTLKWRMRARIGTKKIWYQEVEEVVR